jgi:5-(carboxyamino)imidazole ribonucleotide mutase
MSLVGVVMGSKSDEKLMQPALDMLQQLGIEYEVSVISAHRNPEKTREYGLKAEWRGIEVIIAGAGKAAHLPGVLASWTTLPIIGVPLGTSELLGVDALYSMAQMPAGVPVACVAIDGAKNAALLAAAILALKHEKIKETYEEYRRSLSIGDKEPPSGQRKAGKRTKK